MIDDPRLAAENLFRRVMPEGTNAAKLQKIRATQIVRMRELKPIERQQRLKKRMTHCRDTFFVANERTHGDI
ncbi:hypothetical protein [Sinorhizobium meliloti]|uniref:hypothetical protein n=1 Tax=Rhizobium meliloti TaxID=382 RepID=UPI0020BEBA64|nr:hypothetical protein [Sinorhizobium meliloti]